MTDNRTLSQVEKAVSAMRKKVAAAVKRHGKLQERISALQAEGRVVRLHKDAEIVAGDGCTYVKSDSLNTDPDSEWNWYYLLTEVCGLHSCSCEAWKACKHIAWLITDELIAA